MDHNIPRFRHGIIRNLQCVNTNILDPQLWSKIGVAFPTLTPTPTPTQKSEPEKEIERCQYEIQDTLFQSNSETTKKIAHHVLYILSTTYKSMSTATSQEFLKSIKVHYPPKDPFHTHEFFKQVHGIVQELERKKVVPSSLARKAIVESCHGDRFVELVWRLSCHIVWMHANHHAWIAKVPGHQEKDAMVKLQARIHVEFDKYRRIRKEHGQSLVKMYDTLCKLQKRKNELQVQLESLRAQRIQLESAQTPEQRDQVAKFISLLPQIHDMLENRLQTAKKLHQYLSKEAANPKNQGRVNAESLRSLQELSVFLSKHASSLQTANGNALKLAQAQWLPHNESIHDANARISDLATRIALLRSHSALRRNPLSLHVNEVCAGASSSALAECEPLEWEVPDPKKILAALQAEIRKNSSKAVESLIIANDDSVETNVPITHPDPSPWSPYCLDTHQNARDTTLTKEHASVPSDRPRIEIPGFIAAPAMAEATPKLKKKLFASPFVGQLPPSSELPMAPHPDTSALLADISLDDDEDESLGISTELDFLNAPNEH